MEIVIFYIDITMVNGEGKQWNFFLQMCYALHYVCVQGQPKLMNFIVFP